MANLWGDLPEYSKIITPVTLLNEQAAALQEMSKGMLAGEVAKGAQGQTIIYHFRIVAPALGNYRVQLFNLSHGVISYPSTVNDNFVGIGTTVVNNEGELINVLKKILTSEKVRTTISQLMSQITATSDQNS
jgi:hypothetical protein